MSDGAGALVLARLMWSLAYQRARRTIVAIGPDHLVPTPFDGDPADPIVIVNGDLGRVDAQDLRAVRAALARPSDMTVRLHAFGLELPAPARREPNDGRERVERIGGCIVYTASAAALRATARGVHAMRDCDGMEYRYLRPSRRCAHADGEVQVLADFRARVSAALVARRALAGDARSLSAAQRESIWRANAR